MLRIKLELARDVIIRHRKSVKKNKGGTLTLAQHLTLKKVSLFVTETVYN